MYKASIRQERSPWTCVQACRHRLDRHRRGAVAVIGCIKGARTRPTSARRPIWPASPSLQLADALKKARRRLLLPRATPPACNLEAHLFSEAIGKFRRSGTVLGVTAGNVDHSPISRGNRHCGGKFPVAPPGRENASDTTPCCDEAGWSDGVVVRDFAIGSIVNVIRI